MNLIGWIVAGISLLSVTCFFGYHAWQRGRDQAVAPGPEIYILAIIALLLLGIFCLLLQIYCALVVEQLNKQARTTPEDLPY
jgi:formate hydrogenlyase subunit 3/multisubunit Na+/H+ antiporter MnhD subunit